MQTNASMHAMMTHYLCVRVDAAGCHQNSKKDSCCCRSAVFQSHTTDAKCTHTTPAMEAAAKHIMRTHYLYPASDDAYAYQHYADSMNEQTDE
eukprot:scaffold533991_cov32-Prasinocladus_malaysianus.AAC.1